MVKVLQCYLAKWLNRITNLVNSMYYHTLFYIKSNSLMGVITRYLQVLVQYMKM